MSNAATYVAGPRFGGVLFLRPSVGLDACAAAEEHAARLNAVLQAQISEVRREVARMGLRAEDE